ncbi:hypothetical protein [Anabaena sp. 4-3]|nr:hypothetical protein [Anabaena sp. 4-3]
MSLLTDFLSQLQTDTYDTGRPLPYLSTHHKSSKALAQMLKA